MSKKSIFSTKVKVKFTRSLKMLTNKRHFTVMVPFDVLFDKRVLKEVKQDNAKVPEAVIIFSFKEHIPQMDTRRN